MSDHVPQGGLEPADAQALDALVSAGFDSGKVGGDGLVARRAARLREVLGLLDMARVHGAGDTSLVDVTFARVLQARQHALGLSGQHLRAELSLCEDDQEAMDAWVMAGYDAARAPASLRERARRHELLAALVAPPAASPGSLNGFDSSALVERTLAAVQAEVNREAAGLSIEAARPRRGTLRLADIISVAAVILIGSAVLFPVMTAVREQTRRAACNNNMMAAAMGMGAYAGAHRDSLPLATASLGKGRWWDVGTPQHSNSANLFTLARTGFAELASLACPGNPASPTALVHPEAMDWRDISEVSYSYQILFGPERPHWSIGGRTVVLADRSPVVLRAVRGEMYDPWANSPNHGGAGQHVLFNDGTALWIRTPVLEHGDNIWLPRSLEIRLRQMTGRAPMRPLSGTELPDGADDAFLGP